MSEAMRVDPELLVMSGAEVDNHSQTVYATHTAADATIDSSLFTWAGQSQHAMAAKAAQWVQATDALSTRLYAHAEALRVSGMNFAEMDHQHADTLASVHQPNG